jgi:hypothetical protein
MNFKSLLPYLWKVPLCGFLFFIGFIPGGQLAAAMGLSMPEMPIGADPSIVAQYTVLTSLILALGLAGISRGLSCGFLSRWLILFFFTWIAYAVVLYLPAALLCSAAVAWFFPSIRPNVKFTAKARTFFANRTLGNGAWRLLAAFLAFPITYYFFGRLISPIVLPYYLRGTNELALPAWDRILPVLAVRSLLFLLACLPIVITWNLSSRSLFLSLGLTLFILVGGIALLEAYWLPTVLRLTHGLEIFADEMVYAGALVLLLLGPVRQSEIYSIPVQLR